MELRFAGQRVVLLANGSLRCEVVWTQAADLHLTVDDSRAIFPVDIIDRVSVALPQPSAGLYYLVSEGVAAAALVEQPCRRDLLVATSSHVGLSGRTIVGGIGRYTRWWWLLRHPSGGGDGCTIQLKFHSFSRAVETLVQLGPSDWVDRLAAIALVADGRPIYSTAVAALVRHEVAGTRMDLFSWPRAEDVPWPEWDLGHPSGPRSEWLNVMESRRGAEFATAVENLDLRER